MRALVVDDEREVRDMLTEHLKSHCFAVDTASDGTEGSYMARTNAYDIIILDNMLPGMGQEDQSHAFERFYRSKNSSNPNTSTGLGLAITRRIVERHSGTITLKSALNNGTNVSMSIPLTQQADSPQ